MKIAAHPLPLADSVEENARQDKGGFLSAVMVGLVLSVVSAPVMAGLVPAISLMKAVRN